jgi:alpha-beta hydrolase superfamily lysophospholipase
MSTELRIQGQSASGLGHAEAIYFASGEHRLFGWLHPADLPAPPMTGLVVCGPFGFESICSHRTVRSFAEAAAAVGIPSLRFDYWGTGDSPDMEADADQVHEWTLDVVAAVAELKRRTGVQQVVVLGFRLGALLALQACKRCTEIDALAVIAPIISGRRYLREVRMARLAASTLVDADPAKSARMAATMQADPQRAKAAAQADHPGPEPLEVSGFRLSAASVAALAKIDLSSLGSAPAPEVLVIDGTMFPVSGSWSEKLAALGAHSEYHALPGMVEMLMTPPEFAAIPQEMLAATLAWLERISRQAPQRLPPRAGAGPANASESVLALPYERGGQPATITETPEWFGPGGILFGIVTEPNRGELRRRAVILPNAGADHHIGASRIYVSLARRWARSGYVVLRMDLAGIGDSATRPGHANNEVFPPEAIDDLRAAVEYLRARSGITDVAIAGLCSGAYHALRAAVAGVPVKRILMINPQNYFWENGKRLDDLQLAEVVRNPAVYRQQMFSLRPWIRLITGQVNVWRIGKVALQRTQLMLESVLRDLARALRIRLPRDLGYELETIAARGVRVVFVFARGEPGVGLLKLQAGSSVRKLGDRCRVHVLEEGDHVFTRSEHRRRMEEVLSEELFART